MIIKMQRETDQEIISSYAKEFYDISINYYSNQEIPSDNNIPRTIVERTLVREIKEKPCGYLRNPVATRNFLAEPGGRATGSNCS